MTVNIINADKGETTLSFTRHEVLVIRRALQKIYEELTEDDKWLLLEINGVDDLLKDGNFTRFLSYHKSLLEKDSEVEK